MNIPLVIVIDVVDFETEQEAYDFVRAEVCGKRITVDVADGGYGFNGFATHEAPRN